MLNLYNHVYNILKLAIYAWSEAEISSHLKTLDIFWEFHSWVLHLHHFQLSSNSSVPPIPSQIHDLFYTYYFYRHTQVHLVLLIFICLGLTTWFFFRELVPSENWLPLCHPVAFHLGMGLCKAYPIHTGTLCLYHRSFCWHCMLIVIMQLLFRQQYCWDFMGKVWLSGLEDTTLHQAFCFSVSCNLFSSSSIMFSDPLA